MLLEISQDGLHVELEDWQQRGLLLSMAIYLSYNPRVSETFTGRIEELYAGILKYGEDTGWTPQNGQTIKLGGKLALSAVEVVTTYVEHFQASDLSTGLGASGYSRRDVESMYLHTKDWLDIHDVLL